MNLELTERERELLHCLAVTELAYGKANDSEWRGFLTRLAGETEEVTNTYVCHALLNIDATSPRNAAMGYLHEIATWYTLNAPLLVGVDGDQVVLSAKDVAEALGHKNGNGDE